MELPPLCWVGSRHNLTDLWSVSAIPSLMMELVLSVDLVKMGAGKIDVGINGQRNFEI